MHIDSDHFTFASGVFLWLAISIAMHSFPSTGDARSIWTSVWSQGSPVSAKLIGTPLVAIIFLGTIGSVFWLDANLRCRDRSRTPKLLFQHDSV